MCLVHGTMVGCLIGVFYVSCVCYFVMLFYYLIGYFRLPVLLLLVVCNLHVVWMLVVLYVDLFFLWVLFYVDSLVVCCLGDFVVGCICCDVYSGLLLFVFTGLTLLCTCDADLLVLL